MLVDIYIETERITTVNWSQVPDEGEILVIEGKDYKVYARTWYIFNSKLSASSSEVHIFLKEI